MKKEVYSQPVSEIFELKLLGSVLQGGSPVPGRADNGFNSNNDLGVLGDEDGE